MLQLPGEIISYDLSVVGRAIGGVHAPLNANMSSIERDALSATLAAFADKNAATNKDVIDGEVLSVHTTIDDAADVDPPAIDSSDADKKDAPTTGADADKTGKKFSDVIGKKYAEDADKKDADRGKNYAAMTGKKDNDTVGAIRHAFSNATGKKNADKDNESSGK